MTLRKWLREMDDLHDRRIDILAEGLSVNQLREYRDNNVRSQKLRQYCMMTLALVMLSAMVLISVLEELEFTNDASATIGYLFAMFVMCVLLSAPTRSFSDKLTEKIMEKLEEKK